MNKTYEFKQHIKIMKTCPKWNIQCADFNNNATINFQAVVAIVVVVAVLALAMHEYSNNHNHCLYCSRWWLKPCIDDSKNGPELGGWTFKNWQPIHIHLKFQAYTASQAALICLQSGLDWLQYSKVMVCPTSLFLDNHWLWPWSPK